MRECVVCWDRKQNIPDAAGDDLGLFSAILGHRSGHLHLNDALILNIKVRLNFQVYFSNLSSLEKSWRACWLESAAVSHYVSHSRKLKLMQRLFFSPRYISVFSDIVLPTWALKYVVLLRFVTLACLAVTGIKFHLWVLVCFH